MLRMLQPDETGYFDTLIANSTGPEFAQTTAWARFKSQSWRPRHYLYEEMGEPVVAITIWLRKIPLLPYYLAYAPRGPVLLTAAGESVLPEFWSALQTELRRQGAFALKIDPAWTDDLLAEQLKLLGFRPVKSDHPFGGVQPKFTFRLDIGAEPDELLASIPKKIRYNIRYPEKNGVVYRQGTKADIPDLMAVLQDTSRRKGFLGRNAAYYERLLEVMGDQAALIIGYKDGQVVAASITIVCGRQAWAVYGGMMREFSQLRAYYGLNWQRMLWAKSKGATSFDFSGVPVDQSETSPLYGLYQFKKSFGGNLVEFIGEYELPVRPFLYWCWQTFAPGLMKMMKWLAARGRGRQNAAAGDELE